ncbi:MAG: hypothetical protein ACOH2E_06100 [Candidatus Paracaedibacter sp.]
MKKSFTYLETVTLALIMLSYVGSAQADFGISGQFHTGAPDQVQVYGQHPSQYPGQQPYGQQIHPGQQAYMQPGMQQQMYGQPMHPGMQDPYGGHPQPYGQPMMHPGMQQPYGGHPGMQPYGQPMHPGMYSGDQKDQIKDQVKSQFKMMYPGANDDQWENFWDNYKMQHGIH